MVMGVMMGSNRGAGTVALFSTACYLIGYACLTDMKVLTLVFSTVLALNLVFRFASRTRIFLVDFSVHKPDVVHKASRELLIKQAASTNRFDDQSLTFMRKMLERSGIGQESYVPFSIINLPEMSCLADAWVEAQEVVFGAVDALLGKTGAKAEEIGILVVNCSLFVPAPSLSAMVVNRYKLKENIISHNLGGMGCSAGLISIDLAKHLLKVHPNTRALVVSTENMTLNGYFGNNRPMLVTNSLFRMGCAAVLLSNRPSDSHRSKYELIHTVRTHKGSDDRSYGCVFQEEDDEQSIGISLSKDLMSVAGEALKTNITTLGPLVLPLSEKLLFLWSMVKRKVLKMKVKQYMPDFKLAFDHFCIHAGGRAVLDEMEKNMSLTDWHMEPSRMTLWRWGNTSSSSLWYELAYTEAKGRVKKGDRLWQIAFGSGFKCNSAVWKAVRSVKPEEEENPWREDIHLFPVEVPKMTAISA